VYSTLLTRIYNSCRLKARHGYTMVELSFALGVLGILAVGAMSLVQHNLEKKKHEITQAHFKKIDAALENFAKRFGYMPCPARPDANLGDPGFGLATAYNSENKQCDDANLVSQAGAVPVRTLHLEDKVIRDGWNNKFTYRISDYAGSKIDLEENTAFQSSIRLANLDGTPLTNSFDDRNNGVLYVLISHGAIAKDTTLNKGAESIDRSNINMDKMSARATIGNANHEDALYYRGAGKGDFDDVVRSKRRNDIFRPKQKIAPFAMPQEFCQSSNSVLKAGGPANRNSGLYNKQLADMLYTAANRMKAICDASPLEALAYTPPADVVCAKNDKFWHEGKEICFETLQEHCEDGDEGAFFAATEVCYPDQETRCTDVDGENGAWSENLQLCLGTQEEVCDNSQTNYNSGAGTNYYGGTCEYCPENLTYRDGSNCYANAETWCDASQTNYNSGSGTNYRGGTCEYCPSNLTYRNGNNCYSNQQSYCNAIGKPFLYKGTCYNNAGKKTACINDGGQSGYTNKKTTKSSQVYCCSSFTSSSCGVRCSQTTCEGKKFTYGARCGATNYSDSYSCNRGNTCYRTYSHNCYNSDGTYVP